MFFEDIQAGVDIDRFLVFLDYNVLIEIAVVTISLAAYKKLQTLWLQIWKKHNLWYCKWVV